MANRAFIEPVDCDGVVVQVGDEVKSTSLLTSEKTLQGLVVEVGCLLPAVKMPIAQNIIAVRCGTSIHRSAAFLWKVVGHNALS